jgi:hypothetical protein
MTRSITRAGLAAALALTCATSAQAAIVGGSFTISSVDIVDLYSATFDGGLIPCASPPGTPPYDAATCTFFNGYTPTTRNIVIAQTGTGNGTLDVQYDNATGAIAQVDLMDLYLPRIVLTIAGSTVVTADPNTGPALGLTFIRGGTVGAPQNTVDADEGSGIGVVNVFRHDDAPNLSAPDFATFSDIVDSCTGGLCGLIGILSLDGVRYQLEGTVSGEGGDNLSLLVQTANNSVYRVNLTTAAVPVPAAGWLLLPAVAAVAARARRRKAA